MRRIPTSLPYRGTFGDDRPSDAGERAAATPLDALPARPARPEGLAIRGRLRAGADDLHGVRAGRARTPGVLGRVGPRRAAAARADGDRSRTAVAVGGRREPARRRAASGARARRGRRDRDGLRGRRGVRVDPKAGRRPRPRHGLDRRPDAADRRLRGDRRHRRLLPTPHELALVGGRRHRAGRPPRRLESGQRRQRPTDRQRTHHLDRRRADRGAAVHLRQRPEQRRRPALRSRSGAAREAEPDCGAQRIPPALRNLLRHAPGRDRLRARATASWSSTTRGGNGGWMRKS